MALSDKTSVIRLGIFTRQFCLFWLVFERLALDSP